MSQPSESVLSRNKGCLHLTKDAYVCGQITDSEFDIQVHANSEICQSEKSIRCWIEGLGNSYRRGDLFPTYESMAIFFTMPWRSFCMHVLDFALDS